MTRELVRTPASGGLMLVLGIVVLGSSLAALIGGAQDDAPGAVLLGIAGILSALFVFGGLFITQPNQAAALTFFGKYVGSVKTNGFWWVNPFTVRKRISLRARNLNGQRLKVNDKMGNPIEIAAVVVWEVNNTAEALFDVDAYEEYVTVQSESAVRHLAQSYPYDSEDHESSLRGDIETVSHVLEKELQERLGRAGVRVIEARLSHLAYAPEIAGAMLQRQQAAAIIAARARIVEGAVGMVESALHRLAEKRVVELDDERKAQMVSNLLVVLCGQHEPHPIVNAGTLY
jgi:regulator of protease activity HflC (stomatin/prohibitin superfamily)